MLPTSCSVHIYHPEEIQCLHLPITWTQKGHHANNSPPYSASFGWTSWSNIHSGHLGSVGHESKPEARPGQTSLAQRPDTHTLFPMRGKITLTFLRWLLLGLGFAAAVSPKRGGLGYNIIFVLLLKSLVEWKYLLCQAKGETERYMHFPPEGRE